MACIGVKFAASDMRADNFPGENIMPNSASSCNEMAVMQGPAEVADVLGWAGHSTALAAPSRQQP